jgi:hypothetical protein
MSDSNYPRCASSENPDVPFQFSPICHQVDPNSLKPNEHGNSFSFITKRRIKSVTDSNYLSISGNGRNVARGANLLLSDFQKVAQRHQLVHIGKDPT